MTFLDFFFIFERSRIRVLIFYYSIKKVVCWCRSNLRVNCPVACKGFQNPLAHLVSLRRPPVPPERLQQILTLLQSNILDPGSISPLVELLLGAYHWAFTVLPWYFYLTLFWRRSNVGFRDVYPGSRAKKIRGSASASNNLSILTLKIVSKITVIWSGMFIPDPDVDFLPVPEPESRGQRHRIPDPHPQHCYFL